MGVRIIRPPLFTIIKITMITSEDINKQIIQFEIIEKLEHNLKYQIKYIKNIKRKKIYDEKLRNASYAKKQLKDNLLIKCFNNPNTYIRYSLKESATHNAYIKEKVSSNLLKDFNIHPIMISFTSFKTPNIPNLKKMWKELNYIGYIKLTSNMFKECGLYIPLSHWQEYIEKR